MKQPSKPIDYEDIFDQWVLVESDFSSVYHVELEDVFRSRSWRWFTVKIAGLLSADTRLSRFFSDEPEGVTNGGGVSDNGGFDSWQSEAGQVGMGPAEG